MFRVGSHGLTVLTVGSTLKPGRAKTFPVFPTRLSGLGCKWLWSSNRATIGGTSTLYKFIGIFIIFREHVENHIWPMDNWRHCYSITCIGIVSLRVVRTGTNDLDDWRHYLSRVSVNNFLFTLIYNNYYTGNLQVMWAGTNDFSCSCLCLTFNIAYGSPRFPTILVIPAFPVCPVFTATFPVPMIIRLPDHPLLVAQGRPIEPFPAIVIRTFLVHTDPEVPLI